MSETVYLSTICLFLGTVLLVFGMRYYAAVQQARARLANDQAYRELAAASAAAQADTARALARMGDAVADLQARLQGVESILKEVE